MRLGFHSETPVVLASVVESERDGMGGTHGVLTGVRSKVGGSMSWRSSAVAKPNSGGGYLGFRRLRAQARAVLRSRIGDGGSTSSGSAYIGPKRGQHAKIPRIRGPARQFPPAESTSSTTRGRRRG
jgi:hypothetical protein